MPEPLGMTQFFAMEAAGYLERLDALVSGRQPPQHEEFVRLARALRGSALMANQRSIAQAVAGLEHLAKGLKEERLTWDPATQQLAVRAVDDLKILVRNVSAWSEAEEARARALAEALERATGVAPGRPSLGDSEAGTRAFISQLGVALASVLTRAAQSLNTNPSDPQPLQGVLQAVQPLKGVAGIGDYPPLQDLLDGLERGIAEFWRQPETLKHGAAVLEAAAKAISRAAQETARSGKPDPESPEGIEFARLLGLVLGAEPDVVPIETLYYSDGGPHVIHRGTAPDLPAQFSKLELVSHGEHLCQLADELERATSAVQRELRAQALMGTLKTLSSASGGELAAAVGGFARAARSLIGRSLPAAATTRFARALGQVGSALSSATRGAGSGLAARIEAATQEILSLAAAAGAPAPAAAAAPPEPRPAAVTAPPEPAPEMAARPRAAAAVPHPKPDVSDASLAASYLRYEELLATAAARPSSLDELLRAPQAAPPEVPAEETVVPIAELCYSGPAALEQVLSLRSRVEAALGKAAPDGVRGELSDLIEEIFDLVELGIGRKR